MVPALAIHQDDVRYDAARKVRRQMAAPIDGRTTCAVVLVGIDFSPLSEDALRAAAAVGSRSSDFELHLVHVLPVLPVGTGACARMPCRPMRR